MNVNPFYISLNRVLSYEDSRIIQKDEPLSSEMSIPFGLSNSLSNSTSNPESMTPQIRRWMEMMRKIREYLFSKQVAFIIVFYYTSAMEDNPAISKFKRLAQMLENRFIDEPIYNHIITLFQKAQRVYHAMSKLARIVRLKQTPVQMTSDLYMTELHPTSRSTFVLLDTNRIYYFSLKDLARILTESLTFSYSFFSEPTICKNPYNNMPFSKATLYNIYFQMKTVFCVVPPFIQLFFETDFNIYEFKKRNEWTIREYKIREYIDTTDPTILIPDILRMFRTYDTQKRLDIHREIPANVFVAKVKPLYQLYLNRKYCFCQLRSEYYENELKYKIHEFVRLQPTFGRKICVAHKPLLFGQTRDPPRFHLDVVRAVPGIPFATTHQYNDALYNRFIEYGVLADTIHVMADNDDSESTISPTLSAVQYPENPYDTEIEVDDEDEAEDEAEDEDLTVIMDDSDDIFHEVDSEPDFDTDDDE